MVHRESDAVAQVAEHAVVIATVAGTHHRSVYVVWV